MGTTLATGPRLGCAAIALLSVAFLLCGSVAVTYAQHTPRVLIGVLDTSSRDTVRAGLWDLFKDRLRELGYVERQTVEFDFRWGDGNSEVLPDLARQLVERKVSAIVTAGTPAAFAASQATSTIPIVMATGTSVGTGLADASAKIQNVTGMSDMPAGLSARRLELIKEALPKASTFAVLSDEANPASPVAVREIEQAARALGVEIKVYGVRSPSDFKNAASTMKQDGVGGVLVLPGAMFFGQRKALAALAIEHKMPTLFVRGEYVEAGGLISYGASIQDNYRRAATYVDKILKGAKPSELAVDEVSEFELVINLKTAQAIGVAIAPSLLERARKIDR